ncbi:MAG: GEVED domain-containing protein, partial [Planctomycetes bacterium]|nr:GEVED domain-containing protein [Planctomycetota bacterium]
MNRWVLSVILAAMMPLTVWGAIVYSGSQNVVIQLSPMNSMSSMGINLAEQGERWDDFRVELWLDTGMMNMTGMSAMMADMSGPSLTMMTPSSRLALTAPGAMLPVDISKRMGMDAGMGMGTGMGMGMGGILGFMNMAVNLPMGSMIGPMSVFQDWAYLYNGGGIDDEGGYVGIMTPDGRYGWLHVEGQSGIDTETHSVVIDGWAYEDRPGVPVAAGEGPCDWFPGGPHKMHWPQVPDFSPAGVDVSGMGTVLADDFKCTASGPIARIHIWGSFAQDILPERGADSLAFEVSIYSDVPAQQGAASRPGTRLWTRTFSPGEYAVRLVHDGPEGWADPLQDTYARDNHRQAYQYNFCVDQDAFVQQEGTIYWLVVKVLESVDAAYRFGWKSTGPELRWNDDAVCLAPDGSWRTLAYPTGHEYAGQALDLAFVIDSGRDLQARYDLGDAPDSSNSLGTEMTAYPKGGPPSVAANFPTVYQAGSPPYGPLHLGPKDRAFLGYGVTLENEADIGPDVDPSNNLDPPADAPDADGSDDGVIVPLALPEAKAATFDYVVTVINPAAMHLYVNVWFDWNRDGDWDDTMTCPDGAEAPEWAVQNQELNLPGIGPHTVATPSFRSWHPSTQGDLDPIWMRITLSDTPWDPAFGAGGAGPANGYGAGETEDYYFQPKNEPAPATRDWGDAPGTRTSGYPTLAEHSGAHHTIAGPWLGDEFGGPDAESDGQPDPNALGDDLHDSDDEDGVWIPPLIQGELAILTVSVGGGGGIVQGWIDFNGDGAWQDAEQVFNGYLPDGTHTIPVSVPPDAVVGQSFARFRISTQGGLEAEGPAANGEVEDYDVSIRAAPPQLKRIQWPDLTFNGIDIRVDNSDGKTRRLADDFKCTASNRITEVSLWGSWKNDRQGKIQKIHLSVYADDPAGAAGFDKQNRFSKPAPDVLWSRSFGPTEFTETPYHVVRDVGEWWWDPATGQLAAGGDTEVWRVDISISPQDAFLQQGSPANPIIYWLMVRVETTEGQFGWKTRRWPDHYMDDAVWDLAAQKPAAWKELRYPKSHPYYEAQQNSIDLAFALTYTAEVVEHPTTRPGSVTQCPVVETQCPAVETRCPAVKTQCPTYATRCPTVRTRCPATATKCPPVATRCPTVKTKCPTTATRCPPTRTKCPAMATRCPESLTKCPPTPTKCQVVETQCPAVATKCPVSLTKCPEAPTKCPAVTTKCPPTVTQCSTVAGAATQCPAVLTQCPPVTTRCPESLTKCPPTATQCQVVETQCPAVATKCPAVLTKCPESLTKCPPTATNCQAVDTQCPAVETKCPPAATKCPVYATRCPEVLTKCPPTATQCQVVETQCPAVETKCPAALTKCPESLTKCPPTPTNCQAVDTQCPAVATKCPPVTTKCPPTATQ